MSPDAPQSTNWGGIAWSDWRDFDKARDDRSIPQTAGVYRFRAHSEPGLLYIGESGARWTRLDDLARARRRHTADYYLSGLGDPGHNSAPYFIMCENAGCRIEVSWAIDELPDKRNRRATEARLIWLSARGGLAALRRRPEAQGGGHVPALPLRAGPVALVTGGLAAPPLAVP